MNCLIFEKCEKSKGNYLKYTAQNVMIDIEKAPTPKWMPLNWVFVLTDTANPVCRQDWHFSFTYLSLSKR